MNHQTTQKADEGLRILYQSQSSLREVTSIDRTSRAMIGLSFPEISGYGFACVVIERRWDPFDEANPNPPGRQFVVIDEADAMTAKDLFDGVVNLKDRYLCQGVACSNSPQSFVEALRTHEGLSRYTPEINPYDRRTQWPNYVSSKTVAFIRDMETPSEDTMDKEMDTWWDSLVIHPDTGTEVFGAGENPLKKLVVMGSGPESNFSTQKTRQGIQTKTDTTIRMAVYLAVKALEETLWLSHRRREEAGRKWIKSSRSGY